MKRNWNYGQRVLVLPDTAADLPADAAALRVLLQLARDLTLAERPALLAKAASCTEREAKNALLFWQEHGVFSVAEEETVPAFAVLTEEPEANAAQSVAKPEKASTRSTKKLARADEIPNYSSSEIADLIERRESLSTLINEAQQIVGKIFNTYEINILLGMADYLSLGEDYILLLLEHCKRIGKTSMRSIERYAISLSDQGILTVPALVEYINRTESLYTLEGQVRKLFGMNSRAFSEKQKGFLRTWQDYGYGEEIIRRSYEVAADAVSEPTLSYVNAILDRWHSEGLNTPEEIDKRLQDKQETRQSAKKERDLNANGSFNTDEFFEAAMKRSFRKKTNAPDGQ